MVRAASLMCAVLALGACGKDEPVYFERVSLRGTLPAETALECLRGWSEPAGATVAPGEEPGAFRIELALPPSAWTPSSETVWRASANFGFDLRRLEGKACTLSGEGVDLAEIDSEAFEEKKRGYLVEASTIAVQLDPGEPPPGAMTLRVRYFFAKLSPGAEGSGAVWRPFVGGHTGEGFPVPSGTHVEIEADIFPEAFLRFYAVAEPLGATELDGLPDRPWAVGLAGVDRDVEVLPVAVLEGEQVVVGRESVLGPGDVEPDHADVPVGDRGPGDLEPVVEMAHGGADHLDRQFGVGRAGREPGEDRFDHLVQREALLGVEFGCEPHLGVDDAVGREVFGTFAGDPFDGGRRLHHADGVGEGLQVEGEILAVGSPQHPRRELVGVGGGETLISGLVGQFDDRGGAEAAVEMVVEQDLGGSADALERRGAHIGTGGDGVHTEG